MRQHLWLQILALSVSFGSPKSTRASEYRASEYRLKGKASVPSEWSLVSRASPDLLLEVSIGLYQPLFPELERRLLEVSDPSHHDYGQYLTATELQKFSRPTDAAIEDVFAWLHNSTGLDRVSLQISTSPAGDWVHLSLSVGDLEKLLQTEYYVFQHQDIEYKDRDNKISVIRSLEWFLPRHLARHVDIIEPTTAFVLPKAQWSYGAPDPAWEHSNRLPTYEELVEEDLLDRERIEIPKEEELPQHPTTRQACNRLAISPLCLRVLYGTHDYKVEAHHDAANGDRIGGIGVINFLGEVANRSDVQLYLENYRPEAAKAGAAHTFVVEHVAGGEDQQTPNNPEQMKMHKGYEGALDAQTVLGISWPVPLTTYNVGGRPPFHPLNGTRAENTNEPYLAWLRHMRTLDRVPQVISISYAEDEKTVPPEYARRVCQEFAQLTARGVSILVASGDYGVGKEGHCVDSKSTSKRFMPSFPASCPYVTAVGATRFIEPEMVAFDARNDYASGGGFSDLFEQPAYQKAAVQRYLDKLGPNHKFSGLYNPAGRAYPDISSMGYHFAVVWNGSSHMQDGTSASTPTVAAIIALVNDALAKKGRPSLGFLNPWIYSAAQTAFTDVKYGSNLGCNTSGFPALEGWDPATGFGTPWFPELMKLALQSKFRPTIPWYYADDI